MWTSGVCLRCHASDAVPCVFWAWSPTGLLSSLTMLGPLARKLRGVTWLHLPSTEVTSVCHHPWISVWVLKLRSSQHARPLPNKPYPESSGFSFPSTVAQCHEGCKPTQSPFHQRLTGLRACCVHQLMSGSSSGVRGKDSLSKFTLAEILCLKREPSASTYIWSSAWKHRSLFSSWAGQGGELC